MSDHESPTPSPANALDSLAPLIDSLARRLEELEVVDGVAKGLQAKVHGALGNGVRRDLLTGRFFGHALHPVLTDLPIGFWTSAFTLDLIGGKRSRPASQLLVALGVLSALPTAASGAADWSDTTGAVRRVGLVHAALNSAAIGCFTASWLARRRGRNGRGVAWGLAGSAVATGGGYLGGHLVQRMGLAVDHTAFDELPGDWTPTRPAADFAEDAPERVDVDGVPIVVVRHDGDWYGLANRCSHAGGPLDEGELCDDGPQRKSCIECPWHGSRFRLRDGTVAHGPAFAPQPVVAVHVEDEVVTVRDADAS